MKVITVNTDAGFCRRTKIGSYAFYIRSGDFLYKGSGVFREKVEGSTHAEFFAVLNALHILREKNLDFDLLIFNRDNIQVHTRGKFFLAKKLKNGLKCYKRLLKNTYGTNQRKVDFRHVKAHSDKSDARSYVNDWCDKECKRNIRNYKKNEKNRQACG